VRIVGGPKIITFLNFPKNPCSAKDEFKLGASFQLLLPNFIEEEVKRFYPKTVADLRPGVRVTVREKGPDFKFPGTSRFGKVLPRILVDPAVM